MSSSNYYTMRSAKVRIAEELSKRGWTIHGFKEDESDSMTDYYSPANWDGIATKNGFTLCVDTPYEAKSVPIEKYNYSNSLTYTDIEKIKKLEQMTAEHGATEGEAENAKRMIEKIKASNNKTDKPEYEIVGYTIAHMANPGRCKWHIEKDSAIFDKGTGITKYDDVPDSRIFDIDTMQFKDSYKYHTHYNEELGDYERVERTLTEDEEKAVKDLKALILRWERVINSMNGMYNGTEQNRKEADEQQQNEKMEKVIEKITKKVLKMVEVTNRKNIQVGDFLTFSYHGGFWKVTDEHMQKGTWKGVTESRKAFSYERVGAASRGYKQIKNTQRYYDYEFKILQSIEKGNTKIYELKEVEEVTEVEKWVRVRPQQTTKKENTYKAQDQETKKESNINITASENNYDFTITQEQDTRDNSNLWVVRLNNKLDREQWKEYDKFIRSKKGYYSRFKGGHIFKFDPTEILNQTEQQNENSRKVAEVTEQAKEQAENLLDISTEIIEKLHLNKMEYINSIKYKEALTSYLLNSKVKISKDILKYLHDEGYSEFEKVLTDLLNNENNKKDVEGNSKPKIVDEPTLNYEKLIDKINKQIENNNKKIEHLSGDYLTNTWKRMREQESRDNERHGLEADNRLLNYLLDRCNSKAITELEQNLIIGTFRSELHSYYRRHFANEKPTSWTEIEFPHTSSSYGQWYNEEIPKKQKRLNKAKIFNTEQLMKAVEEYKNILELIERGNTTDLKVEQIKKLEREYKMYQKGDINFTSSKELLNMLMDYAGIEPKDKVLEPEAGIGYIADKLKEYSNNIDVCEYDYSFSELLKLKGYNVLERDFLKFDKFGEYDKIVMNPPFSNNQDIKHIRHAYNMLNSNGKLVAICSNHWTFTNDKQSQEFRNWLEQIDYEVYDVPEKSFEFTNVNCKILVINKNENDIAKAM